MKRIKHILFFILLQLTFVCFNNAVAQTLRLNDCEMPYNMPQFGPSGGSIGFFGSTGTNGFGTPLAFSYQNTPLSNPTANAHSGIRVLQINTGNASSGNSQVFYSGVINFNRNCANSPMTVSFWMYRNGIDGNADRVRLLVNTAPNLTGATLLMTINRSRALSPIVYGMDGWYRYEATIPPSFNTSGFLMIDAIDASGFFAGGNIYIDDIQYHDNGGGPGLVTGGVADAGEDITICPGGQKAIGCAATPNTTYAWSPAAGLSSTTISNPIASPAVTTNYMVTTTTSGGGCTAIKTDNVTVNVIGPSAPVMSSATSTNICSGTTLAFPFAASNAPTGYIWLAADNAITSGESYLITRNSGTLNDVITSPTTQVVTYSVSAYNNNCPAGTNPIQIFTVNVNVPPTATAPPNVSICPGNTVFFSTVASGGGTYTYQWQEDNGFGFANISNGGVYSGATVATLSITAAPPSMNTYQYRCIISNGCTPSYTTTAAILTVLTPPTITLTGTSISCNGGVGNIVASGTGVSTYSWSTGQTTAVINNVPAGTYACTVTSVAGCTASATYALTQPPTPLNTFSSGPITICGGATGNISLFGSGGGGMYTFNWSASNNPNVTGESLTTQYGNTISNTLVNTSGSNQTVNYTYQITDSYGCVMTNVTNITVTAALTYTANVVDQPILTNVGRCATKQEILRLKVDISSGTCPSTPTITNIVFTAAGTQAEVTRAYIYYTGSNPNFTATNLFATNNTVTGGSINIVGSQTLTAGSNYFWLAYDINPLGTGLSVDATFIDFILSGGSNPASYTAVSGNPPGSRAISACISPGGIITGLTYWLKSTDGSNLNSTTHSTPINNWSSSFSNISDLTQPTAVKQPIFTDYPHDTTFNFNPYLSFDGADDILQNTSITDLLANDGLAMLVCAKSTTAAPNNNASFGFQKSAGNIAYQINPEASLRYKNSGGTASSFNVTGFTLPDADFIMAKMLSIAGNSSGTPGIADFMRNDNVFQGSGATAPVVETGFTIGGNGDGPSFNRGNSKIAEVITYNRYLPQADLDKVETYAAIKYGIHLDKDYKSSAGTTIWNYATNTTYNHDICGIGRDDRSGLNQKQTQSVNIDEMLTIGLDSIEDSNKNNIAVFANDNSFLVWGNNNHFPRSDYSTIIPIAAPYLPAGIQGRIKRVWKLQGTNFQAAGTFNKSGNPDDNQPNGTTATTKIQVAFDDYWLLNFLPLSNLFLLVDDDGVDFSNALVRGPGKSSTGATTGGARVVFEGVDVGPGENYITLATSNIGATLLPIQLINFNVMCDNNAANITWNTATENNVKDFTIEHSADGINYSVAKIISPKGSVNSGANYSTICNITPSKINYFRLKETSNSNITYCFDPVSISGNCSDFNTEAFISPNPVSGNNGELTIRFSSEINSFSDLKIVNNIGSTIYQTEYKSTETYNSLNVQINNLAIGIYFLEVKNNKGNYRFKFIVGD